MSGAVSPPGPQGNAAVAHFPFHRPIQRSHLCPPPIPSPYPHPHPPFPPSPHSSPPQHEGPLGLFSKGKLASQIVRDVPYAIVTLVSYEVLQELAEGWARGQGLGQGTGRGRGQGRGQGSEKGSDKGSEKGSENTASGAADAPSSAPKRRSSKTIDAICGAAAGGLGSLLTTPMDVVKTRLMAGRDARDGTYSTVAGAVLQMYRQEGLGCFFIGTLPRLAHKVGIALSDLTALTCTAISMANITQISHCNAYKHTLCPPPFSPTRKNSPLTPLRANLPPSQHRPDPSADPRKRPLLPLLRGLPKTPRGEVTLTLTTHLLAPTSA